MIINYNYFNFSLALYILFSVYSHYRNERQTNSFEKHLVMAYTDLLLSTLNSLQEEFTQNWSKCSPIDKYMGKHIDMLSEWAEEEFYCIYKQMPGDWSKSILAAEIIKGNFYKILSKI